MSSKDSPEEYPPIKIDTNAIRGPLLPHDPELIPLVGKAISTLSAGAINMLHAKPRTDPAADAARRITGLTALLAAGEARAVLVLVTTNLPMQARIHVRTVDELLRRITAYSRDHALAKLIQDTQHLFSADGLSKMTPADRVRISAADDNVGQRVAELMRETEKPVRITTNEHFKNAPTALTEFERWAYSQAAHGTAIAAAEIANRSDVPVDDKYQSHDGDWLLWTTGRLLCSIVIHFIAWGVQADLQFEEINAKLAEIAVRLNDNR